MDCGTSNALVRVEAPRDFEEHPVSTVELVVDGRLQPTWPARQVSIALGYADAHRVPAMVTGDWSDELDEGRDFVVLTGEALAAAKRAAPDLVDPRAPSLMLLTESGVNLVAILTRQPAGKRLRRWLAEEVLPTLRRTGAPVATPASSPAPSAEAAMKVRAELLADLGRRHVITDEDLAAELLGLIRGRAPRARPRPSSTSASPTVAPARLALPGSTGHHGLFNAELGRVAQPLFDRPHLVVHRGGRSEAWPLATEEELASMPPTPARTRRVATVCAALMASLEGPDALARVQVDPGDQAVVDVCVAALAADARQLRKLERAAGAR